MWVGSRGEKGSVIGDQSARKGREREREGEGERERNRGC